MSVNTNEKETSHISMTNSQQPTIVNIPHNQKYDDYLFCPTTMGMIKRNPRALRSFPKRSLGKVK